MTTHIDPRTAGQTAFPPQGFAAQPLPHHLAPEHTEPPQPTGFITLEGAPTAATGEQPEYGDYFGFDERHKFIMPDGRQWIEFKVLTEGDLARYQSILKRDVVVEKQTGNARIRIDQVEERHALLQVAVTGWHMMQRDRQQRWVPVTFSNGSPGSSFMQWVQKANPALVQDLAEQVRKVNPFLLAANAETVEQIDKQIEELAEQRKQIVDRMAGEGSSATR